MGARASEVDILGEGEVLLLIHNRLYQLSRFNIVNKEHIEWSLF